MNWCDDLPDIPFPYDEHTLEQANADAKLYIDRHLERVLQLALKMEREGLRITNRVLTLAMRQKLGDVDEEAAAFLIGTLVGIGGLYVWGDEPEIDEDGALKLHDNAVLAVSEEAKGIAERMPCGSIVAELTADIEDGSSGRADKADRYTNSACWNP